MERGVGARGQIAGCAHGAGVVDRSLCLSRAPIRACILSAMSILGARFLSYELNPNDTRVLTEGGMSPWHAWRMVDFASGGYMRKKLLIIVRKSKPTSRRYDYQPDVAYKPSTMKAKTPYHGVIEHDGKRYLSDYDLQGVYEQRHDGAYSRIYICNGKHAPVRSLNEIPFLRAINHHLRPEVTTVEKAMFQHGPNDDYIDAGRVLNPDIGEVFLVFRSGSTNVLLIPNRKLLKELYHGLGICWRYG